MLEKVISKLMSGKWIMTVAFTFTTCYLALIGKLTAEQYVPMTIMIVGFYFGQSTAKGDK